MPKAQPEYLLQCQVCAYLEIQYSDVFFLSDTIATLKLKPQQQVRNKKIQKRDFHCPDIIIFQSNNKYKNLFIELKNETPFCKDGRIKASQNDHLEKQYQTIQKLKRIGNYACFSWGFDMTKEIIDKYFKNEL